MACISLAGLSFCSDRYTFAAFLALVAATTAFAEQPLFISLNATHFIHLQHFATTCIASAFSISGTVLDLLLAPLLVAYGWQPVLLCMLAACVLMLPVMLVVLKVGPLAVGGGAPTPPTSPQARPLDSDAPASAPPLPAMHDDTSASGVVASDALRGGAFWALWASMFLHLIYGSFLTVHLQPLLRTMAAKDVVLASQVSALQFACAIAGKLSSGILLSLESPPKALLFCVAPLAFFASHFLVVDVSLMALLGVGRWLKV